MSTSQIEPARTALSVDMLLAARKALDEAAVCPAPRYLYISKQQFWYLRGGGPLKHGRRYAHRHQGNCKTARARKLRSERVVYTGTPLRYGELGTLGGFRFVQSPRPR